MTQIVLFDLDGTIVDTNELIVQSFLHCLDGETAEPVTREFIIPNMGKPLVEQLEQFSGRKDTQSLMEKYRAFNLSNHDSLVREFPHVREVLAELHRRGLKIGIVTSKIRKTTLMGLKLCGLETFVSAIVTVEDVSKPKPDPEGIRLALQELGGTPEEAVMVGDSHYDIEAAQRAGVKAIGVSWSWKGRAYLETFKPDYMIDDMRELLPIVGATVDAS
ncbi:pyrophosphatase PpaX [Paenibacillus athensensis]|uniref:Pyrophosphatase PpaX n=1 Tax=Paenibacillus athensensis TaxID=1967502 RepID=A0A4Y8PZA9_9BACL|nr:pyrophosphatase PpaX [Paenibacillus athensensis]MCD1258503.1 pyrophosphatase PpaX [Paenibacillus athensensis]